MTIQIEQLAGGYLHPDFDLEFGDARTAVEAFAARESVASRLELAAELRWVLDHAGSEVELRHLWIESLGSAYDPTDDGMPFRRWFLVMLEIALASQP